MFWTPIRRAAGLEQTIKKLLPSQLPPSLIPKPGNLYDVLSRTADGGVGRKVHQLRWSDKQIGDCYWVVTRSKFKCEGKHGKAWGKLFWKNKLVSEREQRISGSLKYKWQEGVSVAKSPKPSSETPFVSAPAS